MMIRIQTAGRFFAAALGAVALAGCSGKSGLLQSDSQVGQMGVERSAIEPQPDISTGNEDSILTRAGRATGRKVDEISNRVAGGANGYYNRAEAGVGRIADAAGRKYDQTVNQAGQAIGRAIDRTGSALEDNVTKPAEAGLQRVGERASGAIDEALGPPALPDTVDAPAGTTP